MASKRGLLTTYLTQPMDPEKKSLNFIFPTKYVIPKSLKFSHWLSKLQVLGMILQVGLVHSKNDLVCNLPVMLTDSLFAPEK